MFISLATTFSKKYGLLLSILIPLFYIDSAASICNNVGPNRDENLSNTCDWSTWYTWDCSCCGYTQTKPFQFRKRAICCEKNVNLPLCLKHCNYSADSDTQFANCTKECASKNEEICKETPPVDITLIDLSSATSSPTSNSTGLTTIMSKTSDLIYASITPPSSSTFSKIPNASLVLPTNTTNIPPSISESSPPSASPKLLTNASTSSFMTTQQPTNTQTSTFFSLSSFFSANSDIPLTTSSVQSTNGSQSHGNFSIGERKNERTQDSIGIILGAVFGSLAGLAILAFTIVFLKRKIETAKDNKVCAESTQRDNSRHNANAHYYTDKTVEDS